MWVKIIELKQQGQVTVADSIAYLTKDYKQGNELIVKRIELAKEMTKELQSKTKLKHEYDQYQDDIRNMDNRVDSLRNLSPDNIQVYDKRNSDEILALIMRTKYSLKVGVKPIEESFDFYLSPDGKKCFRKKGI